ncbi:MAG: N-acetyl-gamma-glutamyl-phosphate reductase [candidate division NC10 bacterium]|nr:N-acetyl-gamma-glutamyl-phosphate reductase [candidate division NC10 bacterium]
MLKVAVAGASGYMGAELLRLLLNHPSVELAAVTSESYAGQVVGEVFPTFSGLLELRYQKLEPQELASSAEVIFLALPHKTAMAAVAGLYPLGCQIIDLSADFRLKDAAVYERWYGTRHLAPDLLPKAAYGLPELNREAIRDTRLVASPGCYPTGAILGLAPLMRTGVIDPNSIVIDAISGASGAGRKMELYLHFSELNENVKAYSIARHRHTPEIEQQLSLLAGQEVRVTFTPHLAPLTRGLLSTISCHLSEGQDAADLLQLFRDFYKGEPFIRILPAGRVPETKVVLGSNFCDIGLAVDERTGRVIVITAIDNLVKGGSGQAVQAMNVMCGFDEGSGLLGPGLFP